MQYPRHQSQKQQGQTRDEIKHTMVNVPPVQKKTHEDAAFPLLI